MVASNSFITPSGITNHHQVTLKKQKSYETYKSESTHTFQVAVNLPVVSN